MALDREQRLDTELNKLLEELSRPAEDKGEIVVGKRTRVEQLADQVLAAKGGANAKKKIPGRGTLVERLLVQGQRLGLDDYRVIALKEVLSSLGKKRKLRDATLAAADHHIGDRASGEKRPRHAAEDKSGAAMWKAAERRASTLYRHAADGAEDVSAEDPQVEHALARAGSGAPLPGSVRQRMESELGIDLARVRVHTDSVASNAAKAVRANAFTVGEDIFFADGMFAPESRAGQRLIAHELAHVVQSWQGRTDTRARVSEPGDALEREAESIATRVDNAREPQAPVRPMRAQAPQVAAPQTPSRAVMRQATTGTGPAAQGNDAGPVQPTITRVNRPQKLRSGKLHEAVNQGIETMRQGIHGQKQQAAAALDPLKHGISTIKAAKPGAKASQQHKATQAQMGDHHKKAHDDLKKHHAAAAQHKAHQGGQPAAAPAGEKVSGTGAVKFKKISDWDKYLPPPMKNQDAKEKAHLLKLVKKKIDGDRAASAASLAQLHAAQLKQAKQVRALKPSLVAEISGAQTAALGQVAASEASQAAAIQGSTASAQATVAAAKAAAKAAITTAHTAAIAAINAANTAAVAALTSGHTKAGTDISAAETQQIAAIGMAFTGTRTQITGIGTTKAAEALALGDSVPLPYSGDKLDAAKKAAKNTAEGWAKDIPSKASDAANDICKHQPDSEEGAHKVATAAKEQADKAFDQLKTALQTAHQQAVDGANKAKTQALQQADQAAAAASASIAAQGAAQVASVHQQASGARSGISSAGAQAIASTQQGVDSAAAGLEKGARGIVTGAAEVETMDPDEAKKTVEKQAKDLEKSGSDIANGLRKSASGAASSLNQQAASASSGMTQTAAAAKQALTQAAQGAAQSLQQLGKGASDSLKQMADAFKKQATDLQKSGTDTFNKITAGTKDAYGKQMKQLQDGLHSAVQNVQSSFDKAVPGQERPQIEENAKKAADAVKPWWERALTFVLTIVVAIVITVVVTALTGGIGGPIIAGILAGAIAGGLSSVAGQVITNVMDGKGAFDNFSWSQVAIGVVSGAISGGLAGGAGAGMLGAGVKAAFQDGATGLANYGIRAGVNFATGMIGDAGAQLIVTGKYEFSMESLVTNIAMAGVMSTSKAMEIQSNATNAVRAKVGLPPLGGEGGAHGGGNSEGGSGGGAGGSEGGTGGGSHDTGGSTSGSHEGGGSTEGGSNTGARNENQGPQNQNQQGTQQQTGNDPSGSASSHTDQGGPQNQNHQQQGGEPQPGNGGAKNENQPNQPEGPHDQGGQHGQGQTNKNTGGTEPQGKTQQQPGGGDHPTEPQGGGDHQTEQGGANENHNETQNKNDAQGKSDTQGKTDPGEPGDHNTSSKGDKQQHEQGSTENTGNHENQDHDNGTGGKHEAKGEGNANQPEGKHQAPETKGGGDEGGGGGGGEETPAEHAQDQAEGELGYKQGTRESANEAAEKVRDGQTPTEKQLRETEGNARGREELEKLLEDPNLKPEERAQLQKELAERMQADGEPTGRLDQNLKEAKSTVKSEEKPGGPGERDGGTGATKGEQDGVNLSKEKNNAETSQTEAQQKRPAEGLADQKTTSEYAQTMKDLQKDWPTLSKEQRAQRLGEALNKQLEAAGVPKMEVEPAPLGGRNGEFDFQTWRVKLDDAALAHPSLDDATVAEVGNTNYHEARHGEQWYMMARHMSEVMGMDPATIKQQTYIKGEIVDIAVGDKAPMTPEQKAQAQEFYDSVYGKNSGYREATLKELADAPAAYRKATDDVNALKANHADPAEISAAEAKQAEALKRWQDAHAKYKALPEEADAWKAGDAAGAAIKAEPPAKPETGPTTTKDPGGSSDTTPKTEPKGEGPSKPGMHQEPTGDRELPASGDEALARKNAGEKFSNKEIRDNYNQRNQEINDLNKQWKEQGLSPEQRARKAYDMRHEMRMTSRDMMGSPEQQLDLLVRDAQKYGQGEGPSFDELVAKAKASGKTGDDVYESMIESSQRTDTKTTAKVNAGEDKIPEVAIPPGSTVRGDGVYMTNAKGEEVKVRITRTEGTEPATLKKVGDGYEITVGKDTPQDQAIKQVGEQLMKARAEIGPAKPPGAPPMTEEPPTSTSTEENPTEKKTPSANETHGGATDRTSATSKETTTKDVPAGDASTRYKLGKPLGSGGEKRVYAIEGHDDLVIGVVEGDKGSTARLQEEKALMDELKGEGMPVVDIQEITTFEGKPAVIMKRFMQGSKDVVKYTGAQNNPKNRQLRYVGESPYLNETSVADLQKIAKLMKTAPVKIDDLQFLIGADGHIVIADPLRVTVGESPSAKNLEMIQMLIRAAQNGGKPPAGGRR
ncbi:MAG TPA: DUF4157 domain-containing protein [Kofleriaceae bacterium]|jgi:hypothetical protein